MHCTDVHLVPSLDQIDSAEPMAILAYYRHLLPWKHLFLWLNRSSSPAIATRNFTHREFAFTLQNEAYLRYQSFSSAEELKREVCRLNPARFEIGPVYTAKVRRVRKQLQIHGLTSIDLRSRKIARLCRRPCSSPYPGSWYSISI